MNENTPGGGTEQTKPPSATAPAPREEIGKVQALMRQGKLQAAAEMARGLLQRYPQTPDLWNVLGAAFKAAGALPEAEKSFSNAARLRPGNPHLQYNLGIVLQDQEKLEEAAACYRRAVEIKPDYADAHNNLGNTLRALGRADAALESFEQAIKADPGHGDAHFNRGNVQAVRGHHENAVESFLSALRLNPDRADGHFHLGLTLRAKEDFTGAAQSFERALDLQPDNIPVLIALGRTLRDAGDIDAARLRISEALERAPDNAEAHVAMGSLVKQDGDTDGAIEHFVRAVELAPEDLAVRLSLGTAYREQGDLQRAAQQFDQALDIEPGSVPAHVGRGRVLREAGEIDAAFVALNRALELEPDNAIAHAALGSLNRDAGDLVAATAYFLQALELDPENVEIGSRLAAMPKSEAAAAALQPILGKNLHENNDMSPVAKQFFQAGLAHQMGDIPGAWDAYCEANALVWEEQNFDASEFSEKLVADREKTEDRGPVEFPGDPDLPKVLHIIGPSRSGKTTIENIVGASGNVKRGYENYLIKLLGMQRESADFSRKMTREHLRVYLARLREIKQEFPVFSVTLPGGVSSALRMASQIPNAYFVFVKREMVANAVQVFRSNYSAANQYAYDVEMIHKFLRWQEEMADLCAARLGERAIVINYEDFVADPMTSIRSIEDMLGLSLDLPETGPLPNDTDEANLYRTLYLDLLDAS